MRSQLFRGLPGLPGFSPGVSGRSPSAPHLPGHLLVLAVAAICLAGCATTDPRPGARKANIRSVYVEKRVDMGSPMRYGPETGQTNLNAVLAEAILSGGNARHIRDMEWLMYRAGIDLPSMIRESFLSGLRRGNGLAVGDQGADGIFFLRVTQHGFASKGFEFSKKTPFVVYSAALKNRVGQTVWSAQYTIYPLSQRGVGATFDEYRNDPRRLQRDWKVMIDRGTDLLLRDYLASVGVPRMN